MFAVSLYRFYHGLVTRFGSDGALLLLHGFALANFRYSQFKSKLVLELELLCQILISDSNDYSISHELIVEVAVLAVLRYAV